MSDVAFDLKDVKTMIAIPVNRDLPWQTARSLMESVMELTRRGMGFEVQFVVGSSIVEVARSKIADVFLKSPANKLLMIDSDQVWTPSDMTRLMALSTVMDVVCAAYPAKRDPPTYLLAPEDGAVEMNEYGCFPMKGLGLGFTIVSREVMEKLAAQSPLAEFPDTEAPIAHIFRCGIVDGKFIGEDMSFFADIRDLGYKVWLDPTINIGHVGAKNYCGKLTDALREVPFGSQPAAPTVLAAGAALTQQETHNHAT